MPVRIQSRTQIGEPFVDTMISAYTIWLERVEPLLRRGRGAERLGMTAKRLLPIVRRQSPGLRSGLDYEITRLRGLPYNSFETRHDADPNGGTTTWMIGQSKHVTMTNYANRTQVMAELGGYNVCVPLSIVSHPNIAALQLIPRRNIFSVVRHPHHYLQDRSSNPFSQMTFNCYGSYTGVIKGLIDEPDFPELFRQLFNHLGTYGVGPPRSISELDFDHDTRG